MAICNLRIKNYNYEITSIFKNYNFIVNDIVTNNVSGTKIQTKEISQFIIVSARYRIIEYRIYTNRLSCPTNIARL